MSFLTSARRGRLRTVVQTKIGQDLLIHNFLLYNGTVRAHAICAWLHAEQPADGYASDMDGHFVEWLPACPLLPRPAPRNCGGVPAVCGERWLPLVVSAPHGGSACPVFIPDRLSGCLTPDVGKRSCNHRGIRKFSRTSDRPTHHMISMQPSI